MARPVGVSITLFRMPVLFGEDLAPWLELAKLADRKGVDQIAVPDHVAFAEGCQDQYPMGRAMFPSPLDESWPEPLIVLAGIAGCTERIRLSTAVLVSPLRSAVLLAKTLATLDVLSRGRLDIVFGGGWQEKEFAACNMPFEGRMGFMDEQAEICRLLWSQSPATYHGKYTGFDDLYCRPFPIQKPLPIWMGIKPSPRNIRRMVQHADGWLPAYPDPASIAKGRDAIYAALREAGRDPGSFQIRAAMMPVYDEEGRLNEDATFAQADELIDAGATLLDIGTYMARKADDLPEFIDRLIDVKRRVN